MAETEPPAGPDLRVEVLPGQQLVTIRLHGELDIASTPRFTAAVAEVDPTCPAVVIDLGEVGFIDSTGVGALVAARRNLESRLVAVSIVNPSDRARFLFELTGLGDLIATPPT
jgi:anti-anti-sigma factor